MVRWVSPVLLVSCLLAAPNSFAATIHVPADQPTIQAGIDASADGDTVLVAPGTYSQALSVSGKSVAVLSSDGPEATFLSSPSGISFASSGAAIIEGFRFLAGRVTAGEAGNCEVRNCSFINVPPSGASLIRGLNSATVKIHRCLIIGYSDLAVFIEGSNCEVVNNTIGSGNRGLAVYGANSIIKNNIIANMSYYGTYAINSTTILDYNDFYNNSPNYDGNTSAGVHDIQQNPLFVNASASDYGLLPASPCINAGDPAPQYEDPDGTRNDMGALPLFLEGVPVALWVNYGVSASGSHVFTLVPTIFWSYYDTAATVQSGYEIEVGTDTNWVVAEMWSSGTVMLGDTSAIYGGLPLSDYTEYYVRIKLHNGTNWGIWRNSFLITHAQRLIKVPTFKPTIQEGVSFSVDGDTVLVAPGTYQVHIDFSGKRILLKSELGFESTTITKLIDGFDLVTFGNGCSIASVIEGFTIENANSSQCINVGQYSGATIRGNRIRNNSGIGIYCASKSMITDNVISACATGVKCTQANYSQIRNNQFSLCNAPLLVESSSKVNVSANSLTGNSGGIVLNIASNSTVAQNTLVMNSGGISVTGTTNADIQRNTLAKNSSLAAIYVEGSTGCVVKNNIVASNTSWGIRVPVSGCCLTATYNDVFGNTSGNYYGVMPGAGSISLDPRFCDVANGDFSLASNSPCIGTGEAGANMGALGIGCGLPEVVNINIGGSEDSLHIANHTPSFAWKYFDSQGSLLTKSELQVGADSDWTVAEMWQPPTINSSDTSIAYVGLPLLDGSTYFVRIRVHNSTDWSNWKSAAFRMNSMPTIPALRVPAVDGIVASLTPALTIKNSTDSENDSLLYTCQVSPDSFTSVTYTFTNKQAPDSLTTITVDSTLTENARYWWRVMASDYYEESGYSATRSFYVNATNTPPLSPDLLSPANTIAMPITTLLPQFSWTASTDIDPFDSVSYTFYIAIDSNFVFANQVAGLVATSHTVTDSLQWSRRYWWKVKAADRNGGATWSNQVFTFRIVTPGDADNNGVVSLSDVVFLVNYIFVGGAPPQPLPAGDPDCSGKINLSDAVFLVNYVFGDGAPPCGRF